MNVDAKTQCAARGCTAMRAAAGIVAAFFVSSCAKEPHPEEGRPEERTSVSRPRTPALYVQIEDGAVTVDARDVRLESVLDRIAEHAGLQLVVQGRIDERVTAELRSSSLSAALRELLRDRSFILMGNLGAEKADGAGGGTLWVLSGASRQGAASASMSSRTRAHESNAPGAFDGVEELRAALADADSNVRLDAASALGDFDDEQRAAMLASAATQDPEPMVRAEALYAVAGRQVEGQDQVFARALMDADRDVRKAAIGALERIGTESAVRTLAVALEDRDTSVRATAVDALGEIGGDAARRMLQMALTDESELVRESAAAQLEQTPSAR
jgi:HEAT repeat protein